MTHKFISSNLLGPFPTLQGCWSSGLHQACDRWDSGLRWTHVLRAPPRRVRTRCAPFGRASSRPTTRGVQKEVNEKTNRKNSFNTCLKETDDLLDLAPTGIPFLESIFAHWTSMPSTVRSLKKLPLLVILPSFTSSRVDDTVRMWSSLES